ncbi:GRAM domain-containing protein 4-like [Mytilus trossulus]|uniref:GRAM domain-containing protein 4-like n=1 Tax=Mytilus trossulus TaxID=6551 RepID=UPI003005D822
MDASSYEVYEEHLKHLEEQLVTVTIENQGLVSELNGYKDKESLDRLRAEIEIERNRYKKLEEKFKKHEKDDIKHIQSFDSAQGWVDVSIKSSSSAEKSSPPPKSTKKRVRRNKKFDLLWRRIVNSVYNFMDDFTEEPEEQNENEDGEPLTVKQLKANINRFSSDLKPYIDTIKGIQQLLAWKTPSYTLLMFMIYLIAIWHGCFVSVILFCLVVRMMVSYLNHLGFQIKFNFFQALEEQKPKEDSSSGITDKFSLVIQVARKVQNGLGAAADGLEKIQSLLTWKTPVTRKLFMMLFICFIMSFTASMEHYSYIMGIFLGIKMFIINYFYNRYPRLKRRYDSTYKTWQQLPTTVECEQKMVKSEINKFILSDTETTSEESAAETSSKTKKIKDTDAEFCQLFSLPNSECPVSGWQGGKRCSLVNKEKSVLSGLKNGKLYLTRSFLCFERTKTPSKKNIVVPLADITEMSKAKPYAILQGSGMSIEIKLVGGKVFTFGAIVYRDEAYDSLIQAGIDQALPWATGVPLNQGTLPTSSLRRRSSSKSISNFTWAADYTDAD